jgi:hypothetical protein
VIRAVQQQQQQQHLGFDFESVKLLQQQQQKETLNKRTKQKCFPFTKVSPCFQRLIIRTIRITRALSVASWVPVAEWVRWVTARRHRIITTTITRRRPFTV